MSPQARAVLNLLMKIDQHIGKLQGSPVTVEKAFTQADDLNSILKSLNKMEADLSGLVSRFNIAKSQLTKDARRDAGLPESRVENFLSRVIEALANIVEAEQKLWDFSGVTASYSKNVGKSGHSESELCARCGKYVVDPELWVETESNGYYPVGPDCASKVRKLGYHVVHSDELG